MADDIDPLQIRIENPPFDPQGFDQAKREAAETGEAVKSATIGLSQLTPEQKKYAQALDDAAGASQGNNAALLESSANTAQATGAVDSHVKALHQWMQKLRPLSQAIPGMGQLMRASAGVMTVGIGIAVLAFIKLKEHIKEVNEALEKTLEENAKPLTRQLEAMRDATVKDAVSSAQLARDLADAARAEETFAQITERTIKALQEKAQRLRDVREVEKSSELESLEFIHDAGLISEEAYFKSKLELHTKFLADKRRQELEDERQALAAREGSLKSAQESLPELHMAAVGAEGKSYAATKALAAIPTRQSLEENADKARKALADFTYKNADLIGKLEEARAAGKSTAMLGGASFVDDYDKLVVAAKLGEKARIAGAEDERRKTLAADSAKKELEDAQKRELERVSFVSTETRALRDANASLRGKYESSGAIGAIESQNARFQKALKTPEGKAEISAIMGDVASLGGVRGNQLTAEQGKTLTHLTSMLRGAHASQSEINEVVREIALQHVEDQKGIRDIWNILHKGQGGGR